MNDHTAFIRAILAAPDDDLPRLIYADFLDEKAGDEPCKTCNGQGWYYDDSGGNIGVQRHCDGGCRSTGRVSNGLGERASFIRCQVELESLRNHGHGRLYPHEGNCNTCLKVGRLERCELELAGH